MKKNPCYKCDKRTPECHSTCEWYREWSEEAKKDRELRLKNKHADLIAYSADKKTKLMKERK